MSGDGEGVSAPGGDGGDAPSRWQRVRTWPRPALQWIGARRWTRTVALFLALGATFVFLSKPGHDLWDVTGSSAEEIEALQLAGGIERHTELIRNDDTFVILFLIATVLAALWLERDRWRGLTRRARPERGTASWFTARWLEVRWFVATHGLVTGTALASVGYAFADLLKNDRLLAVLDQRQLGDVSESTVLALSRAANAKWAFLALTVLGLVALSKRRPPAHPPMSGQTGFRSVPDATPVAHDWAPNATRLGIAVTGGGIRAASFAHGVLQVLRERELLSKARYVTSVSGGGYMAGAITALNHDLADQPPGSKNAAFSPHSPEEQALRRRLRYIASDWSVLVGAIARVVFGVLLNLLLLYAILFVLLRPVGWLIGTPELHPELRLDRAVAAQVVRTDDDPDLADDETTPWKSDCTLTRDPADTTIGDIRTAVLSEDPFTEAIQIDLDIPRQCVQIIEPGSDELQPVVVGIRTKHPGVVLLERGELTIERQPTVEFTSPLPCDCPDVLDPAEAARTLRIVQPTLKLGVTNGVLDTTEAAAAVSIGSPTDVEPVSVAQLSDDVDIDTWHWIVPLAVLALATICLAVRVIIRPDSWRVWNTAATWTGWIGAGMLAVTVILPWLIDVLPDLVVRGANTSPSDEDWQAVSWLPIPRTSVPNLIAWPLLSIAALTRFFGNRKPSATPKKSSRSGTALIRKLLGLVRSALVGLILITTAVATAVSILHSGALNGPRGELGVVWITSLQGVDVRSLDQDAVKWFILAFCLIAFSGIGEAASWSLAPIYKRRLAHAFAWQRDGTTAVPRHYAKVGSTEQTWARLVPGRTPPADEHDRHGYLDGHHGDGTELVLCCAANVLGEDRAPTGRSAVSFTISRSWVGGPEVGWMATDQYLDRMGRRRTWDFTLPGAVAISGAAAAPAMGKQAIGPIGSVLAMLNVRLGAWVPHPRWVEAMPHGKRWEHNPGLPWFVREVIRRYRWEAPYLYVSDGGHWENLGLVEALRRGCTRIVTISAGGDGPHSHAAIAAAIEIARTDLDVDIDIDGLWSMRPRLGDTAAALPSGREFVRDGTEPELARVSQQGYAFGTVTFRANATRPEATTGFIMVIDATMIDKLPVDVHDYAERHPEFPHASTGDQLFTDRDFEAYRVLGRSITEQALSSTDGAVFLRRTSACARTPST